jgi:hypothetical protein
VCGAECFEREAARSVTRQEEAGQFNNAKRLEIEVVTVSGVLDSLGVTGAVVGGLSRCSQKGNGPKGEERGKKSGGRSHSSASHLMETYVLGAVEQYSH